MHLFLCFCTRYPRTFLHSYPPAEGRNSKPLSAGKDLSGRQRSFAVQMIKYVLRTWINGSFPPSTWVMFDHKGITTNNHSEGYNYRLGNNRTIEKHPNCYRWAETIREVPTLSLTVDEDHSESVLPSVLPPLSPLPHTPAMIFDHSSQSY